MRRFFLGWSIFLLSFCVVATIVAAQGPSPWQTRDQNLITASQATAQSAAPVGVKGATVPALDELEQAWLQNVILAQQLANTQCQGLDSVKQFNAVRADVSAKIDAKRPGFTMDWTTGKLVAKVPPK